MAGSSSSTTTLQQEEKEKSGQSERSMEKSISLKSVRDTVHYEEEVQDKSNRMIKRSLSCASASQSTISSIDHVIMAVKACKMAKKITLLKDVVQMIEKQSFRAICDAYARRREKVMELECINRCVSDGFLRGIISTMQHEYDLLYKFNSDLMALFHDTRDELLRITSTTAIICSKLHNVKDRDQGILSPVQKLNTLLTQKAAAAEAREFEAIEKGIRLEEALNDERKHRAFIQKQLDLKIIEMQENRYISAMVHDAIIRAIIPAIKEECNERQLFEESKKYEKDLQSHVCEKHDRDTTPSTTQFDTVQCLLEECRRKKEVVRALKKQNLQDRIRLTSVPSHSLYSNFILILTNMSAMSVGILVAAYIVVWFVEVCDFKDATLQKLLHFSHQFNSRYDNNLAPT